MPPANIDATIIILDMGRNASEAEEKGQKSFFETARECIIRIIERKIISRPKDLIGIILLGSKKTNNKLASQCDGVFKHIELFTEPEVSNWQVLRNLPEKTTNKVGDWFEALIVAAERLKNGIFSKVTCKKIVLMTNFQAPATIGDNAKKVICGFQEDKIEIDIIGLDIMDDKYKGEDIELARKFVQETDGVTATFEDTMQYLLFHRKKAVTPMPWNVNLSIGDNILIPVSIYGRIRDETVIKGWQKAVKDAVTNKASADESFMRKKQYVNTENQSTVSIIDVIPAYLYGQKGIPLSESDEVMLYKSGDKCLSIYGFTSANNVNWHNLSGNGVSYLFGRKGDKKAQATVNTLVHCLQDLNMVGVARRVYNKGNAPAMHVLFPVIDTNDFVGLSVVAICYKEDIKSMAFPPTNLKKYDCTEEQINAFKDLIQAMDLTDAYDDSYDDKEAFPIAETVNPSIQYILDCISFRAMNPDKPLPQPRDDIMMLFKTPSLIEKRSRDASDKLKKLFVLKEVEIKPKKERKRIQEQSNAVDDTIANNQFVDSDIPKISKHTLNVLSEEVTSVGTVDPVADIKTLLNKGKTISELKSEIIDVIECLMYLNDDDYSKAFNTMRQFRSESVKSEASHYNEWLATFKTKLVERQKNDLLQMIVQEKLNFIIKDENNSSTYTVEDTNEESQLYENDTVPDPTQLKIQSDVNDFYDEM